MVLTRAGFMPVMVKHESLTNELCIIKTINGIIECTSNHKFMTSNGWVEAEKLTTDSLLYTLRSCQNQKNSNTTILLGEDTLVQNVLHTENIGKDFLEKKFNTSIGIFGKNIIASFPLVFMFTTKITITTITLLKTWKLLITQIIQNITWMKKEESKAVNISKRQLLKHLSGTHQKQELNGIKSIGIIHLVNTWMKKLSFIVKFVGNKKKFSNLRKKDLGGAVDLVHKNLEEIQESTILKKIACTAIKNIPSINTLNPNFVPCPALLEAPTKKDSVKRVYNLTVKDHHEYVVNEFLVKNCNDAMLYSWREARNYLWKEQPKPEDIDSNEYMDKYAKQLSDLRRKQNEYQY